MKPATFGEVMDWGSLLSAVAAAENTLELGLAKYPPKKGGIHSIHSAAPGEMSQFLTNISKNNDNPHTLLLHQEDDDLNSLAAESSKIILNSSSANQSQPLPRSGETSAFQPSPKGNLPTAQLGDQQILHDLVCIIKYPFEETPKNLVSLEKTSKEVCASCIRWEDQYHKLKEYHKKHGDCLVPSTFPEDPMLGRWVREQRVEYKRHQRGCGTKWATYRITKLNKLGFAWSAHEVTWENSLKRVKAFRDADGLIAGECDRVDCKDCYEELLG